MIGNPDRRLRAGRNPVGQALLTDRIASSGRKFPRRWARVLRWFAVVIAVGAVAGVASGRLW